MDGSFSPWTNTLESSRTSAQHTKRRERYRLKSGSVRTARSTVSRRSLRSWKSVVPTIRTLSSILRDTWRTSTNTKRASRPHSLHRRDNGGEGRGKSDPDDRELAADDADDADERLTSSNPRHPRLTLIAFNLGHQ